MNDGQLVERTSSLPQAERWTLAEELSGALKTHVFYAVRYEDVRHCAAAITPELVPALRDMDLKRLAAGLLQSPRLTVTFGGVERTFQVPGGAADMIALIDGRRTLRQIHGRLRAKGAKLNWAEFLERFLAIYDVLHPLNIILFAGAVVDQSKMYTNGQFKIAFSLEPSPPWLIVTLHREHRVGPNLPSL